MSSGLCSKLDHGRDMVESIVSSGHLGSHEHLPEEALLCAEEVHPRAPSDELVLAENIEQRVPELRGSVVHNLQGRCN